MTSNTSFNSAGRIVELYCSFSHPDQWADRLLSKHYLLSPDETIAVSIKERPSDSETLLQDSWGCIALVHGTDKRSFTSTSFDVEAAYRIVIASKDANQPRYSCSRLSCPAQHVSYILHENSDRVPLLCSERPGREFACRFQVSCRIDGEIIQNPEIPVDTLTEVSSPVVGN